ncbi:MAG: SCO family protein [Bacteroidetes bacterium]|nr:SCO family protein [Bacteroidota bacterium]
MKKLIFIAVIILFTVTNCKNKNKDCCKNPENSKVTATTNKSISIFDLPSTWTTQNNQQVQLNELKQKVIVMAMIFTNCPSACPRIVADIKQIDEQIPKNQKENVHFILVSMDPERDTAQQLLAFATEQQLDLKRWTLLHGNESDVLDLAGALNVRILKQKDNTFDHSNIISIINNKGNIVYQQNGLGADATTTLQTIQQLLDDKNE